MPEAPCTDPSGLTLPVWVAAAARAALQCLLGMPVDERQVLTLPDRSEPLHVPVQSVAPFAQGEQALAISRCDPGPGLDLTRGLEIWVRLCWRQPAPIEAEGDDWLELVAGEGVGRMEANQRLCISSFARQLLQRNLRPLLPPGRALRLEVILPAGRALAERTSNAAFGVVDGLALIGTQAEVQASASPDQLQATLEQLTQLTRAAAFEGGLVVVIGENGLDLARSSGLAERVPVLKVGNWIGPVLVAAAEADVQELLLLGYHGKLIKLAGGIFHTHHHLADGRLEVLVALAVREGWATERLQPLLQLPSLEAALLALSECDPEAAGALWQAIAAAVEQRSRTYLERYGRWPLRIGAALFDRSRCLRWAGPEGLRLLNRWGGGVQSPI
ncbi:MULTISPECIES: cobalt-precorrin-5B (C(1))-methyltransferase CbiD [unclassified Synechococcus]|uniref:cobalt-precorrin-5B (C(1))-methyltransferase CbiD n=1 Tax=unclassified Synechococcus TaxID=2626047 RepID=UPI0000690609|nr:MULTISPECIES: cobalt-precorrin-5B (C(1))-methyltransferase CbiD [unclassified Synechococcus]EAQ70280.1 CbiD protein [Synechococcus sp. RS9917]